MIHYDKSTWEGQDFNDQILTSHPKNFHSDLAKHYSERLQEIINAGLKYTRQYFFVRNSLNYHKKQR